VMDIGTTRRGSAMVLRPEGRLNMVSAADVRRVIAAAVEEGTPRLVVDLGGTSFIDSSGLGSLVAGLKTARQAGGDLRIAGATDQALLVLRLTNLDRVLRPHETVEDALDGW
jgi:anti-sigma B factor antagonist